MSLPNNKAMFETFGDGVCSIRLINDDGEAGTEQASLRYQERTVGVRRYYEAMTAKVKVDMLIRVPYQEWLTTEYRVVINDSEYEIVQCQTIHDTRPKVNDLTLHLSRQRRIAYG